MCSLRVSVPPWPVTWPVMAKSAAAFVIALGVCAPVRAQYEAPPFDSIHLAVPEISQARDWYVKNMGGNIGETADRVAFGKWTGDHPLPLQLIFDVSTSATPSAGSVIDSIGFSFNDLDATVKELQAAGVKVVTPVTQDATYWKRAVVDDPWGTRLELVEDQDLIGLHHVTLRVKDPKASLDWYIRAFGGDRATVKGRDVIRYRDLGLFYLFAVKDDSTVPSKGHSIDHLAWGPLDLDKVVNDLKTLGVQFSSDTNPRGYPSCNFVGGDAEEGGARAIRRLFCTQPDQLPHRIVYLEAPEGVRVELVQHLEAGGH
jgi:catechol 2,3-dioxygenase-like lactoylglutathione lyase family enzyme